MWENNDKDTLRENAVKIYLNQDVVQRKLQVTGSTTP